MLSYVFRPKGCRVFRGRYRLSNGPKIYDVPLGVDKRHVAEAKLNQLRLEREAELLGQLAPKALRDAAQHSLSAHLADYVADLAAQQCSRKHVALARNRVSRLFSECGWKQLGDVTSDGFNQWRARQSLAPKTTNEYLGLASAFFNWLKRHGRCLANPLELVTKAETRGKEQRRRRALSDTEIESLIRSSGKRALPYFFAAYTGLRRGEMKELVWSDVHLDVGAPFVLARASTTKNKKSEPVPLPDELATALRAFRDYSGVSDGKVFRHGLPTAKTLRRDLKGCGRDWRARGFPLLAAHLVHDDAALRSVTPGGAANDAAQRRTPYGEGLHRRKFAAALLRNAESESTFTRSFTKFWENASKGVQRCPNARAERGRGNPCG